MAEKTGDINYSRWLLGKLVILLFLLSQFYLAKRYREPYPCVIMPAFTHAHPRNEAVAVYEYRILKMTSTDTSEWSKEKLFPYCPPAYLDFSIAQVFYLPNKEKQQFCKKCWHQVYGSELLESGNEQLWFRLEVSYLQPVVDSVVLIKTQVMRELICTKMGVE